MALESIFEQLAIAAGLGLLVGLQRERTESRLAGIRTFPLITVLGTVAALLGQAHGGWIVAAGLLALAALTVMGNLTALRTDRGDPGMTTEAALLLMYLVGAYLVHGPRAVAITLGAGTAVLLQLKGPMHRIAKSIGDHDFRAITQFVLISLVVLPVLPDRTYGPYQVLNPQQIWLMVVLIVGISLGGYLAYKRLGARAGALLAGCLGGLISSTATTVSYARRCRTTGAGLAAVVILIASAVVFVRVLLEMAVVAPELLPSAGLPIAVMLGVLLLTTGVAWLAVRPGHSELPPQENPSELRTALIFGALYAGVLLAVAAARDYLGDGGLYIVAALSGLTDMDAITLSTCRLAHVGRMSVDTTWRVILIASLSNLAFKLGAAALLAGRDLGRRLTLYFGAAFACGALLLWLWP